jgi:hypothetical protein
MEHLWLAEATADRLSWGRDPSTFLSPSHGGLLAGKTVPQPCVWTASPSPTPSEPTGQSSLYQALAGTALGLLG